MQTPKIKRPLENSVPLDSQQQRYVFEQNIFSVVRKKCYQTFRYRIKQTLTFYSTPYLTNPVNPKKSKVISAYNPQACQLFSTNGITYKILQ